MARNIVAVVAGIFVVGVGVAGLQYATSLLFPLPEGLDPADAEALAEYISSMPASAWMLVFASEIVGVFLGALVAGSIARDRKAVFVGALVVVGIAGSITNWVSFSHPMWFIIGQLIAYTLVFFGAVRLLGRPDHRAA